MFGNLGETTFLVCEKFTSGFRSWPKNVACWGTLLHIWRTHHRRQRHNRRHNHRHQCHCHHHHHPRHHLRCHHRRHYDHHHPEVHVSRCMLLWVSVTKCPLILFEFDSESVKGITSSLLDIFLQKFNHTSIELQGVVRSKQFCEAFSTSLVCFRAKPRSQSMRQI